MLILITLCEKICLLLISLYEQVNDLRMGYIRRAIALRRWELERIDKTDSALNQKRIDIEYEISKLTRRFTKV
ncbi:hypothetical protein [uncultured Selenomonas sp.]|uniref:hypothetical protein n=1 Tax=uncultured Selenomonas sp. TaxID=159275 RepID=UPI0020476575|nr:hypothetical protein [uncultured Selenomonas sp.]DAR81201.1 MAG TPA: hypothetical protein [Caudoviricetes sp.]